MAMLECDRVEAHLNEFLDGTLSAAQATELNAHLEECSACRGEYQALMATRDLLRSAPLPDSTAAQERVLARFRHAAAADVPRTVPVRRVRWMPVGAAAFAAASLLLVGIRLRPVKKDEPMIEVADADNGGLPLLGELAQMQTLHARQSLAVMGSVTANAPETTPAADFEQKVPEPNKP